MMTSLTIAKLNMLKRAMLKDGKIDWEETSRLLSFVRPLAAKNDYLFQDFESLLRKCRADETITHEESDRLAQHLDTLCGYLASQRLRFWLIVVILLLLIAVSLIIGFRMYETMRVL